MAKKQIGICALTSKYKYRFLSLEVMLMTCAIIVEYSYTCK